MIDFISHQSDFIYFSRKSVKKATRVQ